MAAQVPICVVPTGLPAITQPTSVPSPTSFIYTIPRTRPFNHVVVFLLPGVELPPSTAAAVYIAVPNPTTPFRFLGGIGPGKESAVFKITGLVAGDSTGGHGSSQALDMDAPQDGTGSSAGAAITLGISIESAASVSEQMAALQSPSSTAPASSQALVQSGGGRADRARPDTLVLAQRIIKNAFNFLASFSGNVNGGVEVVPLKAFEEWWKKFESRVRSDPGFLEKDGD